MPMEILPYRQGANALIIDSQIHFLLIQKQVHENNQWDFPGGGLDTDEDPAKGVLRELEEELGSTSFEIIKQSPIKIKYDWPRHIREAMYNKHGIMWQGQEKFQFVVRFTGDKDDLIIQEEELKQLKWVPYADLKGHLIFEGQWENAKKVIEDAGFDKI